MPVIVTPVLPFPNIYWWSLVQNADKISFDVAEHFEKMSYRNRYYITGANGLITLSVPLTEGRGQRRAMRDVLICNKDRWQVQHWRTLVSVYRRAPYFEHYEPSLEALFHQPFGRLVDFNLASVKWVQQQVGIIPGEELLNDYKPGYPGATDLRTGFKPGIEKHPVVAQAYYQVFSEKNGFYPNLSILDLLFSEGPFAAKWLNINRELIGTWK